MTSAPLVIDAPLTSTHWVLLVTWVGRMRYVPLASGPPPGAAVKVAVNVVFVAGTVMSWVAAPPSDHDANVYCVPASVCGDGAPIDRIMPTTFGTDTGAVTGVPSSSRPRPVGLVCSDTVATRGVMSRVTVCVRPDESRTVR